MPSLKYQEENFLEWSQKVSQYEQEEARRRINSGENIDDVLKDFSKRLLNKFMFPIIKQIKEIKSTEWDPIKSAKQYKENYLDKHGPKPDHIYD